MCDACSDFLQLLVSYEAQFSLETNDQPILTGRDVDTVFVYVQTWPARQCMCCYRDAKNLERFSCVTQGLIYMAASQLKALADKGVGESKHPIQSEPTGAKSIKSDDEKENPEVIERDKLLILVSKIFLLNFPLYVAYKHTIQAKLDELTQQEMQNLNLFCDLHDSEIPIYLLKNVSWFCKMGGLLAMTTCFTQLSPELLPISTAHAMISIVCNLKLWMNYKSMVSMLVPLRSCVLRYMCKLSDQDLRTPTIKSMADFMWNAIKDPLDSHVAFDVDGLDLAFKYFTSSTLTMRLAGITQINNQIGMLAEICVGESLPEAEAAPRQMADWLINNNIISHIFGPNLHVEVIKQSHIILNFLAMEGRITCEHMDVIWAAAQLKHCSKPVHDLLPGLVKHLAAAPTLHLYSLLTKLEPKEHTEQTLYLASALIKALWSRGGGAPEIGLINVAASNAGIALHKCTTSSENSVSLDPSNSEEEHGDSSAQSESRKSESEDIDGVEIEEEENGQIVVDSNGPPPCKLARKQVIERVHCNGSSTDSELDGIAIKTAYPVNSKWSGQGKNKSEKRAHVRKKAPPNITILPEGIENIPSSTSQDEADTEDSPSKLRKRRKLLRKSRAKRQKGNHKRIHRIAGIDALNQDEVDSDNEIKNRLKIISHNVHVLPAQLNNLDVNVKPAVYLEESSSCSELGKESHEGDCPNFLALHSTSGHILEMLSGEEAEVEGDAEGSYSSRMSNKSEKNMADFDGEDSVCEDELARLTEHAAMNIHVFNHPVEKSPVRVDLRLSACFKVDNVCQPGNTLLWDLLQDDKICHLGEGLALEAEKTLCNLICYTTDKEIRMKFIEGCLNNLANNMSVIVSLRMLPKLLTSFRGLDMHHVTHWADRQHHMMMHFFNNLKVYTANPSKSLPMYTHQMQVQVRLHFLSAVFSPVVSPNHFKLTTDQVDILWECLAHDSECSDELFSWLLSQTKTTELHALKIDALRQLYTHHLPSLPPEKFSMICLSLFQQLCSLNNLLTSDSGTKKENQNVGMDHMWKIALRACNTEVSMAAIQYINSYYMGHNLQYEGQFVWQCMTHLKAASEDLTAGIAGTEEGSLLCIQRALLLMKTHIETFRRRYAFHLRKWALEGKGIGSHSASLGDRPSTPIRLIVQSGSSSERCFLDLFNTDYIAELRAEIVKWCEGIQHMKGDSNEAKTKLGETWIRIITQGQEVTIDCDEKTLGEMGFKDNQMVYISIGMSRNMKKRECVDAPSLHPPPPRECLPTLLLLQPSYFEQLFSLMHTLSTMRIQIKGGRHLPHTKAQVLSRRVWDILSLLPTSPKLLRGFKYLDIPLPELLDPSSAQKLMYSLYIVESLSAKMHQGRYSDEDGDEESWTRKFVKHGGLSHLFDIFMSGILQREGGDCSDWQQDCLASLLKILCHLGVESVSPESVKPRNDRIIIPDLNGCLLALIETKSMMGKITSILEEASRPKDVNHYKTGFWGRAQVIHYAMAVLVSWLHCCEEARVELFQSSTFSDWLQRLVLEDPEPAVRREVCSAIYRLCLGVSTNREPVENSLVAPMLSHLLMYLDKAECMRALKMEALHAPEEGKEPYGPASRDYFWLVSRLVDSLPEELVKESLDDPQNCVVDINGLTEKVARSILCRDYLETRHHTIDDDGLIGLLNLMTNLLKHKSTFQTGKIGQELLSEIFDFLFALPSPKLRHVPKCKSPRSRTGAFDLLVELVKGSPENYAILHEKLLKQHQPGPNSPYPWDYWPHEDGRSECGYVGLTNLGATCYMASCMQHLYMMPQARASILAANTDQAKHEPTLKELQRMFAYLLESERKAYNPRSFCKVYSMDHQPLNTAEQKDMAEFFIDLVSKLEEMTPPLKEVIKNLFCGVISNNVVSLDCAHVSRTLEEFYTVRCQVADMRNLYESLDEVTVKDTLEGDNMYTCSHCGKKVRAEKRACFKKLPHILCFNTMRYTFNMLTMLKEKVNTHFSFPLRLNMEGYVEKQLMPQQYQEEKQKSTEVETEENQQYEYDLIGVTVHTGTADGGHYYSFIKDRTAGSRDKWFLFNDAEVKPFDPNQIAAECFGGEMTSKTYDSVTDKFMDFSFEKTNSAYMLFYERCPHSEPSTQRSPSTTGESGENVPSSPTPVLNIELSKELEDWIWQDNMHFIQDKNIFEHTYFNFMWQICGYIPQTILPVEPNITQKAAQLSTTFFIETFIHAKEKPTMVQWVELVTKQFNACQEAGIWFLDHMSLDTWWPIQVLLKCPNQMIRQMFQRLCIHVIQRLKQSHSKLYLKMEDGLEWHKDDGNNVEPSKIGNASCVTRFIKTLLSLMEHGAKAHLKHLTEYFGFLYEFSKMGEEESKFLLAVGAIHSMVHFYLGQKTNEFVDVSEGENVRVAEAAGAPAEAAVAVGTIAHTERILRNEVLLKVTPVKLRNGNREIEIFALLDEASTVSLLDAEVARKLNLEGEDTNLSLKWTDSETSKKLKSKKVSLQIYGAVGEIYNMENIYTVSDMDLPVQSVNTKKFQEKWKHLQVVDFKDMVNAKPKFLIGQDHWDLIVTREIVEGPKNSPALSKTKLGWIVHGNVHQFHDRYDENIVLHIRHQEIADELHEEVKYFFTMESYGVKLPDKEISEEEERAKMLLDKMTKRSGNRWETCLLWKEDNGVLPESRKQALKRLDILRRKCLKDTQYKNVYENKIKEYIEKGYARKLTEDEIKKNPDHTWYLPHFGVTHPNKPGKFRFVFDAASKSNGKSLNDFLLKGPDIYNSLVEIIWKFRQKEIAFSADIREMFHQVKIRKEDQDGQRFLWYENLNDENPSTYVMEVMIFGAVSSPFAAQYVKNRNASEFYEKYPEAVEAITYRHYMDDWLESVESEAAAVKLVKEVISIHESGGFDLRAWVSNSQAVLNVIPPEKRALEKVVPGNEASVPAQRVLGLKWNPFKDILNFPLNFQKIKQDILTGEKIPTKRQALQVLMSLFDPLGLLGSFIVRGKIILQDIWRSGINWDDEIPTALYKRWKKWINGFNSVEKLEIPRHYGFKEGNIVQLHIFSDASAQALSAVAYFTFTNENKVNTSLVMSRTQVTPLKALTIPRAELQAAVMASRLYVNILKGHSLNVTKTYLWTDSKTVLSWIRSEAKKYKTFVRNRIVEIQENTKVQDWNWIPTKLNVADEATRDQDGFEISMASRWFTGPNFLRETIDCWPKENSECKYNDTNEENVFFISKSEEFDILLNFGNFSKWTKLIRSAAYVIKFIKICRTLVKKEKVVKELLLEDINEGEKLVCCKIQEDCFKEEINMLKLKKSIPKDSKLYQLSPYLDQNLIRLSGRTDNSPNLDIGTKRPIILDARHFGTKLIIEFFHRITGHGGVRIVLNEIRQKFWIIQGRKAVVSACKRCLLCRLRKAKPRIPEMGQLPSYRLERPQRIFTFVGMDYFGPYNVRVGRRTEKRYGVLFTCLSVRAIHIELADDLTSDSTILALRRFIARRGQPKLIVSDNGTNLKGAAKELTEAFRNIDEKLIKEYLMSQETEWRFLPPASPTMAGAWERMVRSVKTALKITLKERIPRPEVLLTFLHEAEHIINSRPLTYVSSDAEDVESLTPNHFIFGTSSIVKAPGVFEEKRWNLRKQWKLSQILADNFWNRWLREYLPTLTKRTKWFQENSNLRIGDMVILMDNQLPRNNWPLGKIVAVFPGKDNKIRVAEVKTKHGTYRRPTSKFCRLDLLEMTSGDDFTEGEKC